MNVHTCSRHEPGSPACYKRHHCRCDDCRRETNRNKKLVAVLGSGMIPAGPVQDHIRKLCAQGRSEPWVANRIGRATSYIGYLMTTAKRIHPRIAAEILALSPATEGGLVDPSGTHRRIQALTAAGWPMSWLDRELGQTKGHTHGLLYRQAVLEPVARRYAALYDRLWDQPPPQGTAAAKSHVSHARNLAKSKGWALPLAWDDGYGPHGIDNPAATPHNEGPGDVETVAEKVRWLFEGGLRLPAILERLNTSKPTLWRAIHRTEPDLWERLTREEAA